MGSGLKLVMVSYTDPQLRIDASRSGMSLTMKVMEEFRKELVGHLFVHYQ